MPRHPHRAAVGTRFVVSRDPIVIAVAPRPVAADPDIIVEGTRVIASQNADFIFEPERRSRRRPTRRRRNGSRCRVRAWEFQKQIKPLVDQGTFRAAVLTSLTMDIALEMLVRAMKERSQPPEKTFVEAHSYPSLEELAKRRNRAYTPRAHPDCYVFGTNSRIGQLCFRRNV